MEGWLVVASGILLIAVMAVVIRRWSRRENWGAAHRLALAGGVLLTQAWVSFYLVPSDGVSQTVNMIGDVIFTLGAILLLIAAARTIRRTRTTPTVNDDK